MLAVQEGRDDLPQQALVLVAECTSTPEQLELTWRRPDQAETEKLGSLAP